MKLKLDHLESGQKDLVNKMEKGFDNVGEGFGRVDRIFDKMHSKLDRALYAIVTGLAGFVLKGGFDCYQGHKE